MPNNIIKNIQTGVTNNNLNTGATCNIKERKEISLGPPKDEQVLNHNQVSFILGMQDLFSV